METSEQNTLAAIQASLESITARLERLEAKPVFPAHPSLDKLSIAEAIADEIFTAKGVEKACTFEPNAKPCDHCSMCNSRGF